MKKEVCFEGHEPVFFDIKEEVGSGVGDPRPFYYYLDKIPFEKVSIKGNDVLVRYKLHSEKDLSFSPESFENKIIVSE